MPDELGRVQLAGRVAGPEEEPGSVPVDEVDRPSRALDHHPADLSTLHLVEQHVDQRTDVGPQPVRDEVDEEALVAVPVLRAQRVEVLLQTQDLTVVGHAEQQSTAFRFMNPAIDLAIAASISRLPAPLR